MIYTIENPPFDLGVDDRIHFVIKGQTLIYEPYHNFLHHIHGDLENSYILSRLGLDKMSFLAEAYGYPAKPGDWPICEMHDTKALTRAVWLLFGEILKDQLGAEEEFINPKSLEKFYPQIKKLGGGKELQKKFQEISRKMVMA